MSAHSLDKTPGPYGSKTWLFASAICRTEPGGTCWNRWRTKSDKRGRKPRLLGRNIGGCAGGLIAALAGHAAVAQTDERSLVYSKGPLPQESSRQCPPRTIRVWRRGLSDKRGRKPRCTKRYDSTHRLTQRGQFGGLGARGEPGNQYGSASASRLQDSPLWTANLQPRHT